MIADVPQTLSLEERQARLNSAIGRRVAARLIGGNNYQLEATITGIVGNSAYYYNCENTLLLAYKSMK